MSLRRFITDILGPLSLDTELTDSARVCDQKALEILLHVLGIQDCDENTDM